MHKFHQPVNDQDPPHGERGQSIVLLAAALLAILAFVGIAVDVGFVFARGSQLQAALDAAALAGVTELASSDIGRANTRAGQYLNANDMPLSVTESFQSSWRRTELDAFEYSITATWPVDLYFLRVVGQDSVNLRRSATAAVYPLADIYASRRIEDGALNTSNQGIFGPHLCTEYGDPFSPFNSRFAPGSYTYRYRILVPQDYPSDILRVELFDPDSMNTDIEDYEVTLTDLAQASGMPSPVQLTCPNNGRVNPCLILTGEMDLLQANPDLDLDQINPYWFVRIDENRGSGDGYGNGSCGRPGQYTERYNTATLYELYYWAQEPDGSLTRVPLSSYTGQVGDGDRDSGDHLTDMHWVSPGAPPSYDQPAAVPTDPGSRTSFQISIARDLESILTDPGTGNRYVYLDVTAVSGSSENGFEIWAGPPDYINEVPSEVNARNLHILNNPGSHSSRGATVFGIGNLPMNSNFGSPLDIPLIYVPAEYAGQSIYVSLFDSDVDVEPPIVFYFDTIAEEDWSLSFGVSGTTDGDGIPANSRSCLPGGCNDEWVTPPYEIKVPGILDNCDYLNPNPQDCTPFYGGRLIARYNGGFSDTYQWEVRLEGLPFLTR